jgi:hypothetical protein
MASAPAGASADQLSPQSVKRTRVPLHPWLLNEFEAAALIGLPVKRLRKHRVLGLPPEYRKIGATVRYELSALEEFVSSLPTGGNGVPAAALKSSTLEA